MDYREAMKKIVELARATDCEVDTLIELLVDTGILKEGAAGAIQDILWREFENTMRDGEKSK